MSGRQDAPEFKLASIFGLGEGNRYFPCMSTSTTSSDLKQVTPEFLTVANVATILAVSEDTVLKQFGALDGVIDIGTPGTMRRRRKRVLRIPRRTLERYISDRQVKVRR